MKGGTLSFLGTGTSVGVPMVGCDCEVCRSADPRNQRYRCAVLIRHAQTVAGVGSLEKTRKARVSPSEPIGRIPAQTEIHFRVRTIPRLPA